MCHDFNKSEYNDKVEAHGRSMKDHPKACEGSQNQILVLTYSNFPISGDEEGIFDDSHLDENGSDYDNR